MKKVVERERNKTYYRVLHLPVWIWVFFILPGHLTYDLYLHGPDRRHGIWLTIVVAVCIWRGFAGRLPGVEPQPYIRYYGEDQRNLPYRMVCYTAAWIDLIVPFALNLIGVILSVITGKWLLADLYSYLYYPLALAIVLVAFLNRVPRARRRTLNEGAEKAWFYVAIWTVVPTQAAAWGAWRLGSRFEFGKLELNYLRLAVFVLLGLTFLLLGIREKLPRSKRFYFTEPTP
jgi:energy-converting hydrogenase Eha subunit C